jgi:hypothetical protein
MRRRLMTGKSSNGESKTGTIAAFRVLVVVLSVMGAGILALTAAYGSQSVEVARNGTDISHMKEDSGEMKSDIKAMMSMQIDLMKQMTKVEQQIKDRSP